MAAMGLALEIPTPQVAVVALGRLVLMLPETSTVVTVEMEARQTSSPPRLPQVNLLVRLVVGLCILPVVAVVVVAVAPMALVD
jgi:hypothetical protein